MTMGAAGREALLPLLLEVQEAVGFIPEEALPQIARSLGYTEAELLGIITYYRHLRLAPTAKRTIHICRGISCHLSGSKQVLADLSRYLGIPVGGEAVAQTFRSVGEGLNSCATPGDEGPEDAIQLEECACLGLCHAAPAGMVGDAALPKISLESAAARLTDGSPAPPSQSIPVHLGSVGPLLRNCAEGPILSLDDYISQSGFSKLRNALEMAPEEVIALVETSGLRGRGGAGFPTGAKWRAVHRQPGTPKYLICNADESEPGTFKDRFLLANNPFLVLEGMAIAAYATGAQKAYLFLRFEYNNEFDLLSRCIRETEEAGLLGEGIQGSPFSLEIQPFRSAGGYICGEETALIEAIEGRRGEPRLRPPYPTLRGLWGQPTLVNNVETLANIPLILAEGPEKFAAVGTEGSKGTKLFCLSGDVAAPGLYEAPLGTPLGQMLKLAGTEQAKAVLLGGAAGRLVPAKHVGARYASPVATARQANIHLDFENGAANGAIIVLNDSRCVLDVCLNLMEFFTRECCGLCLVGREGTAWALTLLRQACAGKGSPKSLEALKDVAQALSLASRCGLGQTAANGILGALQYFPEEVEAHFLNQSCPLGVCRSKNK